MKLELPFPPASLSGHNTGSWYGKSGTVAKYRADAALLTKDAARKQGYVAPATGDIAISFTFVPPDRRGDRCSFPNRLKPQIDGIADALKINDARFLPSYSFCDPQSPGHIEIVIGEAGE